MGTGWNGMDDVMDDVLIITDWDMGTGWNCSWFFVVFLRIITDWDMGTGWNMLAMIYVFRDNYNRLGYGYWLELS